VNRSVRDLLAKLRLIFDRRTKIKLVLATVGSVAVALLDTLAIALVLPLVDLATGTGTASGPTAWISDQLGNPERGTLTVILTIAVVGLFILKDLGSMAFSWWISGFIAYERVRVSSRLLHHFLTAPYPMVSRRSSADLLRSMNDSVFNLFNFTVSGLMNSVTSAIAILAIIGALFVVAPLPTLAVVAYVGVAALLYLGLIKPRASAAGRSMSTAFVESWRSAFAALGAMKEVRIRGSQEHFVGNYRAAAGQAAQASRTANFLAGLPKYVLEILFIAAVGLVLLLSALTSAGQGGSSVVALLALFVAAGFRVLPAITGLLGSMSSIRVGTASLDVVLGELKVLHSTGQGDRVAEPALPLTESIELSGVSFRYPDADNDVLADVALTIPSGSSIAFVGGSGAGKSTLVDLIVGLYTPRAGSITVDGVNAVTHRDRWQRNIGYVPQDVHLLDATLAENIAFDVSRRAIDESRLTAAIAQAQLRDIVAELPQGADTPLGEKATRLSGGQRQRVGIARALYHQPQLLVLDEATSALDNETEHRISQTITSLHGAITVIIVAHRLSTVRHCDQIAYLKNGRIQIVGTFDSVRKDNAEFAELVRLGSLEST
jgi:ABC-type multidrug transport system fused ATPase/permease subunit